MKLFIYGTLKRGGKLSHFMRNQKFLGEVKTHPRYRMYNIGWFPGLKEDDKEGKEIEGELYEVDEKHLAVLDRVEGVPTLYQRKPIMVQLPSTEDGEDLVQSYFYNKEIKDCPEVGTCWPI